ncbi:MAG: DUF4065 domain-containing protein [Lachnospiraceae bacterium]|nr:DUF4065 domain-containing protein [Lachnospiraceae bacterium]
MEEHEVQVVHVQEHTRFKGVEVDYTAEYEYCENADEYIALEEMISQNDTAMKDAYRKLNHLLTSTQISSIRTKYGISQKDLSSLLGWGGKTITRYESHQVQDMAHDYILRKIDSDPEWFLELLMQGKERVSLNAFKKYYAVVANVYEDKQDDYLRKAILAQYVRYEGDKDSCGGTKLNLDKVVDVIRYLANSPEILYLYKVKLMKLLWYADNLSYKRYGESMMGLVYTALPMGAVPVAHKSLIDLKGITYEESEFPDGNGYHFLETPDKEYAVLSIEDKAILDTIIRNCGKDTREQIVHRMHGERAYKETEQGDVISFRYAKDLSMD